QRCRVSAPMEARDTRQSAILDGHLQEARLPTQARGSLCSPIVLTAAPYLSRRAHEPLACAAASIAASSSMLMRSPRFGGRRDPDRGPEYALRFTELIPSPFSRHTSRNMTPKPLVAATGPSSSDRDEIA